MSIIDEALRRMKDPLIPTEHKAVQAPPQTQEETTKPAHSWPTGVSPSSPTATPVQQTTISLVMVVVAVLALTAMVVAGRAFWMKQTLAQRLPDEPARTATSSTFSPATAEPTAAPQPRKPATAQRDTEDAFTLTGIVEGLGKPYAVINGAIVGVGDTIGEATLLEIADGSVKLQRADGSETTLSVSR